MLKKVSRGRRIVTLFTVIGVLFAVNAQSQDRARYRDFRLGSALSSVAALAKVSASGAKTLHQRPMLIQELEWRQPFVMSGSTMSQSDPLQRIVFTFYDDQLFRLVVSYDRYRTDGLTNGDMIEAISQTYGVAMLQSSSTNVPGSTATSLAPEFGAPIALWGHADYAVALYRSSFVSEFRVVVTSPQLDALAQTATAEAIRLDQHDAPQREADRKQQEADDTRTAQEKARLANKATFKP
jgi:hypothetical protein